MLRRPLLALSLALLTAEPAAGRGGDRPLEVECERLREEGIEHLRTADALVHGGPGRPSEPLVGRRHRDEAVLRFEQAVRLCPQDSANHYWLATAHILRHDVDAYRRALRTLSAVAPGDVRLEYLQGHFHLEVGGRPDLAVAALERVRARQPRFRPEELSLLLFRAHMDYANRKVDEAMKHEAPSEHGLFREPIEHYQKAVLEARSSPARAYGARRNLAQVLRLANDFGRAQQLYEVLLKASPEDPVVLYGLATVLSDQNAHAAAIPYWERALARRGDVRPGEPTKMEDVALRYGVNLLFVGRSAEAKQQFLAFTRERPKDPRGWFHLGVYHRDHAHVVVVRGLGGAEADAARRRGEVAAALAPLLGVPLPEAAAALATLPATVARERSVEDAERIEDALLAAGVDVVLDVDPAAAIEHLERARAADPDCEDAARALLGIYSSMKPDPARVKELEAWLGDEGLAQRRKAARLARVMRRDDRTEGCR